MVFCPDGAVVRRRAGADAEEMVGYVDPDGGLVVGDGGAGSLEIAVDSFFIL